MPASGIACAWSAGSIRSSKAEKEDISEYTPAFLFGLIVPEILEERR